MPAARKQAIFCQIAFRLICFTALLISLSVGFLFGQSSNWPFSTPQPKGDGVTDDTSAIQIALTAAAPECGTVELAYTASNT
jgi:hypothetical protein